MSLLLEAMEDCVILDKRTEADGRGGKIDHYVEGAPFKAAVVFKSSIERSIGNAKDESTAYTVITAKNINLQYHDVFIRKRDNKIFRVTSDGDDDRTPESASLNMRRVDAEEYSL